MFEHTKKVELSPSIAIIIAGVIIAAAIVFTNTHNSGTTAAAQAGTGTAPAISATSIRPPTPGDHIIGSPTAPIVLIEYSDFQCPYCQLIYPTLQKIVSESQGQIAWVYREFPLTSIHPLALPAANAAECIASQLGSTGFWKYADAVFNNQSQLSAAYSRSLAQQFGANMTQYDQCVSASTYQKNIDADTAEAEAAGGNGTPFVIVLNTKTQKAAPISGALPYDQIMAVIKSVQ